MKPTTLYLIRHAQSEGNARVEKGLERSARTVLGSDLTAFGVTQAEGLARELQHEDIQTIYSSSLLRAQHTAEILALGREIPIRLDDGLKERDKDFEVDAEAATRFFSKVSELVRQHTGETIVVVTHGFVIRTFLSELGLVKLDETRTGYVQNTGWLKFVIDESGYHLIESRRVE